MHREEFDADLEEFKRLDSGRFPIQEMYPVLGESEIDVPYNHLYVLHVGWASRVLAETKPAVHYDIGSCSYFIAVASAFVNIVACDIHPITMPLSGLETGVEELTTLRFPDNSVSSLSCMHSMEHVGLGRYYDAIDPDGDLKAARELQRVLAPDGNLLIVLPVGIPKLVFNAHRIYSYGQVLEMFSGLQLKEFSYIPGPQPYRLISDADPTLPDTDAEGAGCFWFTK